MRLKDKLIRKSCPACDGEITLGMSSLNKKINCPKCRQTIIIPDSGEAPAEKPSPKKSMAREKRNGGHHAPAEKPLAIMEDPEPVMEIQSRYSTEELPDPLMVAALELASEKCAVVYCLCNGILKKRKAGTACCVNATQAS